MPWYDYSPSTADGRPKPYVEVLLWHGSRRIRLLAIVDSGADDSLVDAQYAELLGLERSQAKACDAVGASGETFKTLKWPKAVLELQFGRERFPFVGDFADFGGNDGENLMGRSDFFRRFTIQFWEAAEMLNIDLSPDFPVTIPEKPAPRRRARPKAKT